MKTENLDMDNWTQVSMERTIMTSRCVDVVLPKVQIDVNNEKMTLSYTFEHVYFNQTPI